MTVVANSCLLLLLGINLVLVSANFMNVGVRYKIVADMYSGRENPEWEVDDKSAQFNDITRALNKGPPTGMFDGMGYRGFTVEANNMMGQRAWKTVGRHSDRTLESLLLDSCPQGHMTRAAMQHIHTSIVGHMEPPVQHKYAVHVENGEDESSITIKHSVNVFGGRRKKRQAIVTSGTCSTSFMPENWNYAPVQRRNNCYNYATNRQTNTFAQPGRASGRRYTRTTSRNVYAASVRDGNTPLTSPNAGRACLIALVIWPGEDYHFYRLDNNGYWSHKSGRTRARNVDDSGQLIRDPRVANRGPYRRFAGFLGCHDGVVVR